MTLLNLILVITTLAMIAILVMVFFAIRLRALLRAQLYHRTFSIFAAIVVAGILLAGILGFTAQGHNYNQAVAVNAAALK